MSFKPSTGTTEKQTDLRLFPFQMVDVRLYEVRAEYRKTTEN